MKVDGIHHRTVWLSEEREGLVQIIDQRWLPFRFEIEDLETTVDLATAIRDMHVRGAGCIGATAAHGMYLAALEASREPGRFGELLREKAELLLLTRPTAMNLQWAVDRQLAAIEKTADVDEAVATARNLATLVADEDAEACLAIGNHGKSLIEEIHRKKGGPVNILTHCNAGWLAFVDHGSATAPTYAAHDSGIPVHVWVDETRPRNQGSRLTAWELGQHGVDHTVIVDNAGGHLMQHGEVDLVITGTDRTTFTGDVANKIGTYLKALAAKDNDIPFYVALPSSTFDWEIRDGVAEIPIESRHGSEVSVISGMQDPGDPAETMVNVVAPGSDLANYAFDVTPARLVTGLITERGICEASETAILELFPERNPSPPSSQSS